MIELIVKKEKAVFVAAFLIVFLGLSAYFSLPRESFPEIKQPQIFVTTIYPGVSSLDMESLVTKELERELDGVEGLEDLSSSTAQGVSNLTIKFTSQTPVETALRRTKERVDIAKNRLPADAQTPVVKELSFSEIPILIVTLTHPSGITVLDPVADNLEDEMLRVQGVLSVAVTGKPNKEVAIDVSPLQLRNYGLSLNDITAAIRNENTSIPGGTLKASQRDYSLAVSGEIKDPKKFGDIIVRKDGREAKLSQLATVRYGYQDPESKARLGGQPAISLAVKKRGGENLLQIIAEIKQLIHKGRDQLPLGTTITYTLDASREVTNMIYDLENNIISGLILVLITTYFFLGWRNSLFVSLGIPFSMLISFFVLQAIGVTLNTVVLFSLTLALGMLVDNGIVIVENIYRHRAMEKSRQQAAIDGCREVAIPVATSTLTTALAFLPIIYMPGIMGEFMVYLPKTVIIVLTASLVVALTITTVFCSRFLAYSQADAAAMSSGSGPFARISKAYGAILRHSMQRPVWVLALAFLTTLGGIAAQARFGAETLFFPRTDPPAATVKIKLPSGTPLAVTETLTIPLENEVAGVPAPVESIQTTLGATAVGEGLPGVGAVEARRANIRIGFLPFTERRSSSRQAVYDYMAALGPRAGAEIQVQATEGGPPQGHDIDYEVTGEDYEVIGRISEQLLEIIARHAGELDRYENGYEAIKPEIRIEVDRERASRYGLNTAAIAGSIRSVFAGNVASKFRAGKDEVDVIVRYEAASRSLRSTLDELELVGDKGVRVLLSSVATVQESSAVPIIQRRARKRAVPVFADFKETSLRRSEVLATITAEKARLKLPSGYSIDAGKGQGDRKEATVFLAQAFLVALLLIFLVLVMQFDSLTQPLMILVSVFLSLGGVFWGLVLSQQKFVIIMSGIGLVSLAGVVVNNAIVLIDFINQKLRDGIPLETALFESGQARLRPVLLTALTTVIGLLPMAYGVSFDFHTGTIQVGSESSQFWSPMAWTMIYGLSFATVLTLVVMPVLVLLDHTGRDRVRQLFGSGAKS